MSISSIQVSSDTRVENVADLDGRLLVRIPIELIEQHAKLSMIRGKQPQITRLSSSLKDTGNEPMYPPLVYADMHDGNGNPTGVVHYFMGDGHQRLQAAKDNKLPNLLVQVVTRWQDVDQAFSECVNVQYHRWEMQDVDLFSVLKHGKVTDQELVRWTGKSDSTILRMRKISTYQVLINLVDAKAMTVNLAARLIDKCKENGTKINALLETLRKKLADATREANYYENKYKLEGKPKKQALADLANVATYFKNTKWDQVEAAIADVKDDQTELNLGDTKAEAKAKIEVTEAEAIWQEQIPIFFTGGQKHGDMSLANLKQFRDSLGMIGNNMDAIILQREKMELLEKHPIPPANPVVPIEQPKKPKKQSPKMDVEN